MKIFWTNSALNELNQICEYYQEEAGIHISEELEKKLLIIQKY